MKLLPNINKSVPEAADPALIKPVSDALEALDTALGAKLSTLTTTAKTLVGAINELDGDADVLKLRPWTVNTDANTLGTGIYVFAQGATSVEFNYPSYTGVMLSLISPTYVAQLCFAAGTTTLRVRTGTSPTTWNDWKTVTTT